MSLIKASMISAVGALAKLVAGFALIKIIAVLLGPDGMGLMGQFMSLTNIMILIAGGGISTGIIKYVAEYRQQPAQLAQFMSTCSSYALVASSVLMLVGLFAAAPLSEWLFQQPDYAYLVRVLAVCQFGIAANNVFLSWVSGHKDIIGTNIINVSGTIFGLLMLVPLSYFWGESGMLAGLAIVPAMPVFVSGIYLHLRYPHVWALLTPGWNKPDSKRLFHFSQMLLVTVIAMPLVQMALRNEVVSVGGWDNAGYWQAAIRLSDAYLLFINMVLANYYMPRLSELGKGREQVLTVWKTMAMMLPAIIFMAVMIYLLKGIIVPLLFSDNFTPAYEFIYYQLIGDVFKMSGYMIGYCVIANAMTKTSIFGDVAQAVLFYCISIWFMARVGALGVAQGYALTYVIFFGVVFSVFCAYSWIVLSRTNEKNSVH